MVHHRLNEREANPNKHINFITALPMPDVPSPFSEEDARQLLRALAAQVRPIMKTHGFGVNSFEEYEYNRVFAGRNWNNGETIELVLRHVDGTFMSIPWLLGTLCHELAHIKHMNHGRDFQKLWNRLRDEVTALQMRGYYGDGYWSSGSRLADSAQVGGQGVVDYDLPEYVCGGAQSRSRPKAYRRRRAQRRIAGPSKHTGAQTERRRKPGGRVTAKGKFKGEGVALNADISDEDTKAKGTGFRKQAGSKRAREERALAAEKRMRTLQGERKKPETNDKEEDSETEEDPDYDESAWEPPETDDIRRQTMKESIEDGESNSSQQFMRDFLQGSSKTKKAATDNSQFSNLFNAIEISDDENDDACDLPSMSNPVNPKPKLPTNESTRQEKHVRAMPPSTKFASASVKASQKPATNLGIGRLAQDEMSLRKRESLGLTGGRTLGSGPAPTPAQAAKPINPERRDEPLRRDHGEWACLVCTLENRSEHLACSVCATPRGETSWSQQHV